MGFLSNFVKWQNKAREYIVREPDAKLRSITETVDEAYNNIMLRSTQLGQIRTWLDDARDRGILKADELYDFLDEHNASYTDEDDVESLVDILKKKVLDKNEPFPKAK